MPILSSEEHERLYMQQVTYAQEEEERRRRAPVHVKGEDIRAQHQLNDIVYIFDPRIGFNVRSCRFWINRFAPGAEEGKGWKTLGHRHTVEAVIHILQGRGHSIIDGKRYDWEAGDFICVPVFAWHRHINSGEEDMIYVASTTGPLAMALGTAIYEDERYPEHWVFAGKGEGGMKTLIPGAQQEGAGPGTRVPLSSGPRERRYAPGDQSAAALYEGQLLFAAEEERRRREGRVLVKGTDLSFEPTPMGRLAYVVDSRLGFHVKTISTLVAEIPPGRHSGAHRHIYEEINYILSGQGYSIIEDQRYDWKAGDALCIPVFGWHQHFNTGKEPARFLIHTNRVGMENLGFVLTQQGEEAD